MSDDILTGILLFLPILAMLLVFLSSDAISERHHSHHDTYQIDSSLSGALLVAMVFMGVTGILLSWLCVIGAFTIDRSVVLAFFASFIVVMFAFWMGVRRYRIATYDSSMIITPFVGPSKTIRYKDIIRMEWSGPKSGTGFRNLDIYTGDTKTAMLWGALDLEQILMRIDRFDVLANNSNA